MENKKKLNSHQFVIYDSKMRRLGIKERSEVHRLGYWHKGVQLNIYNGTDILLQCRSSYVDIAKNLFDQSLATQLIVADREDDMLALKRGLKEELGIDISELDVKKIFGPTKIIKCYDYDRDLLNREFVSLYACELKRRNVVAVSNKVAGVFWMPVEKVKSLIFKYPELFTQTFVMWAKRGLI